MNLHKKFLIAAVVSLSLSALLAVVGVLGFSGNVMEYSVLSALSLAYFSLAAYVGALAIERRRLPGFAWFAIVWAGIALVLTICEIWWDPWLHRIIPGGYEEEYIAMGFVFSLFYSAILLLWLAEHVGHRTAQVRWFATIGVVVCAWFSIDGIFEIIHHSWDSYYWRICYATAILTGGFTILFPIMLRITKIRKREQTCTTSLTLQIECPRCGLAQTLPVGHHQCKKCRLRISIDIEEPRCPKCHYIFYEGVGKRCPECGHPIPEKDRWLITKSTPDPSPHTISDPPPVTIKSIFGVQNRH